jgi:dihydroflavonol-4-reductase
MKALVTGSTGFVGTNLVEGLAAAGIEVRALHRPSSRLDALRGLTHESIVGDVLDPTSLVPAMDDVDWVFHVAAVSDYWRQGNMAWLYRVNVGGTRNVLDAALTTGVRRVVFTSSGASLGIPSDIASSSDPRPEPPLYERSSGGSPADQALDESAVFNIPPIRWPYGHSKHLAEMVVHDFVTRGLDVVIVNPTAILGPRDLNLISGSLILAAYRRQVPAIPPGGANYVDVADVITGHIAAAERGRVGERYILGGHNLTHKETATIIAEAIGVSAPRLDLPRATVEPLAVAIDLLNRIWPGEPLVDGNQIRLAQYHMFYDASKAQQELGLEPPIPFQTTVERTFQWYRANGYV